jgi:hypothetical protein
VANTTQIANDRQGVFRLFLPQIAIPFAAARVVACIDRHYIALWFANYLSIFHHEVNFVQDFNIFQWISETRDPIRGFAYRNRPSRIAHARQVKSV